MVLTAGRLTRLRARMTDSLPDVCAIVRLTKVNTEGGWSESAAIVATVPCRVGDVGLSGGMGVERVIGGRVVAARQPVLTMPALTDVRQTDEVTVNGQTYAVLEVKQRSEELVRRVFVQAVGS